MIGDGGTATNAAAAARQVREYLADREGHFGVAIHDLDDGSTAGVAATERFRIASLYKLLVMYRVMSEVESGRLSFEEPLVISAEDAVEGEPEGGLSPGQRVTVREALDKMITISSNVASYALARTVGGWEAIRSVPAELELRDTGFDDYWWSTPNDVMRFFRLLAERELVSPAASDEMTALLERQTRNDRIPAKLPSGVRVAHKTGELEGVRNDAALISGPGVRYLLVVLTRDTEPAEAIESTAELSRLVYDVIAERNHATVKAQGR
jgi:beta-lactamase class A